MKINEKRSSSLLLIVHLIFFSFLNVYSESVKEKDLILLLIEQGNQENTLLTASYGSLCKASNVAFDAYLASEREGGIFSAYGSTVIGGRHAEIVLRALNKFNTTVINYDSISLFHTFLQTESIEVNHESELLDAYILLCEKLKTDFPEEIVVSQTRNLPKKLEYVTPYLYPEIVYRNTVALPLELNDGQINRLKNLGVQTIHTIKSHNSSIEKWENAGFKINSIIEFSEEDSLFSITKQIAERWIEQAEAVDLGEPLLAEYLMPFSIRENRLQLMSNHSTQTAIDYLPTLIKDKNQKTIYYRYGGGLVEGVGDVGLFPLFKENLSIQVVEPGRPPLTVLMNFASELPQFEASFYDMEPSDDQLKQWIKENKILVSYITHSGEMSHDDAIINFVEQATLKKVKIGMGVHAQRYLNSPWSIEYMQVPMDEGGALGLIEPVLHSSGTGVIAESMADPEKIAAIMTESVDKISKVSGKKFVPKGVYCYLDADPQNWVKKSIELWEAIRRQGFKYVISSVEHGKNKVLYQNDDFIVINQAGSKMYPYSPFIRVKEFWEMEEVMKDLESNNKPGWVLGAVDLPLYGYSPYLSEGHKWGYFVRLNEFFNYVNEKQESGKVISVTPHVIARYARMINEFSN